MWFLTAPGLEPDRVGVQRYGTFNSDGFAAYQPGSASAEAASLITTRGGLGVGSLPSANVLGVGALVGVLLILEHMRRKRSRK